MKVQIHVKIWYVGVVGLWSLVVIPSAWWAANDDYGPRTSIIAQLAIWSRESFHDGARAFIIFYIPVLLAPFGLLKINKE